MKVLISKQNPLARFALIYNFSKLEVLTFKVPSLEPDKLPVIKISVKTDDGLKEYRIDTKQSLDDDMEQPIFEVHTVFPISVDPSMSIARNNTNYIDLSLESGEWIEVEYTLNGGTKRIK